MARQPANLLGSRQRADSSVRGGLRRQSRSLCATPVHVLRSAHGCGVARTHRVGAALSFALSREGPGGCGGAVFGEPVVGEIVVGRREVRRGRGASSCRARSATQRHNHPGASCDSSSLPRQERRSRRVRGEHGGSGDSLEQFNFLCLRSVL